MRCAAPEADRSRVVLPAMGTLAVLDVRGPDAEQAIGGASGLLRRLEELWSRFRPDSDVSRLTARAGDWVQVAPQTSALLRRADDLRLATDGAFDVTLGRGSIEVEDQWARLSPGCRLDVGGIGKGAAAQLVVELLRARGIAGALVNFGRSSIGTLGAPTHAGGWRVAIHRPEASRGSGWPVLEIGETQLSTSGGGQPRNADERIIDPRTGRPAASGARSVTVLSADGARAEALSTALLVLGASALNELRRRLGGFEAVLYDDRGRCHRTPGIVGLDAGQVSA